MLFSPSATSPALSTLEDNDLFFRASPSDARQGQVISEVLGEKGIKSIAMTYTNNDYGKGLADSIQSNFEATGGTITINAPHEDGKGDYSADGSTHSLKLVVIFLSSSVISTKAARELFNHPSTRVRLVSSSFQTR